MKAFSLIELLIVVAIMSLLVALSIPAMNSIAQGSGVTRGGQTVGDMIILGRQEAVSKNRDVEMRIIRVPASQSGNTGGLVAMQLWELTDASARPLSKVSRLPQGVTISSNLTMSPLLSADSSVRNTTNFAGLGNCEYLGFKIRPNGMLVGSVTTNNNFLTIGSASDTQVPPANYYTIRVNPITGRVNIYRP